MGLGRSVKHERALLRNLATALIKNESITTTAAKATKLRPMVEMLITKAKNAAKSGDGEKITYARGKISADIFEAGVVLPKMFGELASRYQNREGGYTRILKLEPRLGDNAPQVIIELVDNTEREMKLWMLARIVARLETQNLPINPITQQNVSKLLAQRENGEKLFADIVAICKERFYSSPESVENLPRAEMGHLSSYKKQMTPYYKVVPNKV